MRIYKYELGEVRGEISMPKGARILRVGSQQHGLEVGSYLWALVDPAAELESRSFEIVGTGVEFDPTDMEYLGTYELGRLVLHAFERTTHDR